jgi:hypothetical protein
MVWRILDLLSLAFQFPSAYGIEESEISRNRGCHPISRGAISKSWVISAQLEIGWRFPPLMPFSNQSGHSNPR